MCISEHALCTWLSEPLRLAGQQSVGMELFHWMSLSTASFLPSCLRVVCTLIRGAGCIKARISVTNTFVPHFSNFPMTTRCN